MLSGVLVFTCIQEPTKKYQSTEKEWKVGVVVDEDTADDWNDRYEKQPAKIVKTAEFEKIYKIKPVFPKAKKQYIITIKKDQLLANGEPVPEYYFPKVFERSAASGKLREITQEKLVGNGSVGTVSFEEWGNDYGDFARLKNVLVDDLVEYERDDNVAGSEFGDVEQAGDEFEQAEEKPKAKAKAKPKAKVKAKPKAKAEDVDDDDEPF